MDVHELDGVLELPSSMPNALRNDDLPDMLIILDVQIENNAIGEGIFHLLLDFLLRIRCECLAR